MQRITVLMTAMLAFRCSPDSDRSRYVHVSAALQPLFKKLTVRHSFSPRTSECAPGCRGGATGSERTAGPEAATAAAAGREDALLAGRARHGARPLLQAILVPRAPATPCSLDEHTDKMTP